MKGLLLILLGLVVLCSVLYCQQTQKTTVNKMRVVYHDLEKKLKTLEDDIDYLKKHHKELNILEERGWFISQSRLMGAKAINEWSASLNTVGFTIEPEAIKEIEGGNSFKVSKIIIEANALLDTDFYDFVANVSKNFPGILILRKLSIRRNEPMDETNLFALRHQRPNFVAGEIIYEWFALRKGNHEE